MRRRLALVIVLVGCAAEPTGRPVGPGAGDLVASALALPDEVAPPVVPLLPAAHVQAIASDVELRARPEAFAGVGRIWRIVDGASLRAGVEVVTTADAAVLRLQAMQSSTRAADAIVPDNLVVVDASGLEHAAADAFAVMDDGSGARSVGAAFGTTAVLDPSVGTGALTLRSASIADDAKILLHVHEPAGALALHVQTDRDAYLHGDTASIRASLQRDGEYVHVEGMHARVRDPDGHMHALELVAKGDGTFVAALAIDRRVPDRGRPWAVEVDAEHRDGEGRVVRRSARTAFATSVPTAMLDTDLEIVLDERGLEARWPIEVVAAGRYALSATIWGTDAAGQPRPVALVQTAAYLVPGRDALVVSASDATLHASGLHAPWQIRDLRLQDQGRLGVLHRQAIAAIVRD